MYRTIRMHNQEDKGNTPIKNSTRGHVMANQVSPTQICGLRRAPSATSPAPNVVDVATQGELHPEQTAVRPAPAPPAQGL